jgi:ATP-dependent protease ClpP protease subunit
MPFIELVAQRRAPTPPPGMQPPENAKDWFRVENSAEDSDSTDIYVYDSIGGWFGMYADEFIEAIGQVSTSKINLRLNSPGGSVFEGIAIANAIRNHPATVTVYVDSLAASIASVIALAGDRVVMMPQSQFMVHNASGACYGDATEMTKMADLLDKQSRNIAEAYAQHTGRPLAEWQQYMADETWFTAEEAVAVGLADEAMPMRPKKNEDAEEPAAVAALAGVMNRSWDLSMYNHAGREAAPTPVINQAVEVKVDAEKADEVLLDTVQAVAAAGQTITADLVASPGALSNMSRDDLVALIKEAVRAEMTAQEPQESPPEAENEAEPDADAATENEASEAEDADKKLPPFLQPDEDEDEEEDPDDEAPAEPVDEWASLVDRLTDSPSPSADDVFKSLKEAW